MLHAADLFDLSHFAHAALFKNTEYAWEALLALPAYLHAWLAAQSAPMIQASVAPTAVISGNVWIGPGSTVEPGSYIQGPTIIGRDCEIRQGAYVRGHVITGDQCVIGHATEVKNSILLTHAHAAHFAYVGDSILGNDVNLGAGTKLANLPVTSQKDPVSGKRPSIILRVNGQQLDTGLTKLGALLGDGVQLGCNSVTNPGTIIGQRTVSYPLLSIRKGYHAADQILRK